MAGLPRNVYRRGVQWWASTCTADRANHHLGSDGSSTVVGHAVVGEASATWFWAFEQTAPAGVSTPTATREWIHTVGFPEGCIPIGEFGRRSPM